MAAEVFGILDYIIFSLTLCFSAGIGVYFGCFGSKQKSANEYLFGAGNLKVIPVGLSLYSSTLSAVTILGTPTEIYTFGSQFMLVSLGILMSLFITWNIILPVFCGNKNIKTPYEYVELRFNYKARLVSSLIYILHTLLYMPVILYAATSSFSQTTNISLPLCTTVIGGICIFYTVLGGFSTVIWSDTLQATLMLASCIFILIKGAADVGGFGEVWSQAERGQRIQFFNMDPNPFQRVTFWSATVGMAVGHAAHNGCGASAIQRYMAVGDEKKARISTLIAMCGIVTLTTVCGLIGLTMYAFYFDCDPIANKEISGSNKLVPHYIAHVVKNIPGFSGFFNAGLLCAGLSTLSAELNTVGGLVYYDIIQKIFKMKFTEKNGALIMKTVVLVNGLYYLVAAPFLEKSEFIFPLALSIGGVTYGAKVGLMLLGTTFPKSNSIGAICGTITGLAVVGWIWTDAMMHNNTFDSALPVSTKGCVNTANFTELLNATTTALPVVEKLDGFAVYKLSFLHYSVLGTIITVAVGLLVSYITGPTDIRTINSSLLIPSVRAKDQSNEFDEEQNMLSCELKKIIQ